MPLDLFCYTTQTLTLTSGGQSRSVSRVGRWLPWKKTSGLYRSLMFPLRELRLCIVPCLGRKRRCCGDTTAKSKYPSVSCRSHGAIQRYKLVDVLNVKSKRFRPLLCMITISSINWCTPTSPSRSLREHGPAALFDAFHSTCICPAPFA